MGSPNRLKEVFTSTGAGATSPNLRSKAQNRGLTDRSTVCTRTSRPLKAKRSSLPFARLNRAGGYEALTVWDSAQSCSGGSCSTVPYSPDRRFTSSRNLAGEKKKISTPTVPIGAKPILLEINELDRSWAVLTQNTPRYRCPMLAGSVHLGDR